MLSLLFLFVFFAIAFVVVSNRVPIHVFRIFVFIFMIREWMKQKKRNEPRLKGTLWHCFGPCVERHFIRVVVVRVIWRHAIWRLTIYITLKYHIIWSILKSSSQLTWFAKIRLYYMETIIVFLDGCWRFFFFNNCHLILRRDDAWPCQLFNTLWLLWLDIFLTLMCHLNRSHALCSYIPFFVDDPHIPASSCLTHDIRLCLFRSLYFHFIYY